MICRFCGQPVAADDLLHQLRCDGRQGHVEAGTPPPPRRKRIAETSRDSYARLRPKLPTRQARTRAALQEFIAARGFHPTSGELTKWMFDRSNAFDVNSVRPCLTRMKDLQQVRVVGKRVCSLSHELCYVWDVA